MKQSITVYTACMNPLQTNCYVISNGQECVIIDPSYDDGQNIDRILKKINGLHVLAILLTHGHYDHISAVDLLVQRFNCPVYISETDAGFLTDNRLNLACYIEPDFELKSEATVIDGDKLKVSAFEFDVIATPGHTAGSISFILDDMIFSGDSLFAGSVGRMDLPTGSVRAMKKTLAWYQSLDKNYKIYPGHGNSTTLDYEKKVNYYLTSAW